MAIVDMVLDTCLYNCEPEFSELYQNQGHHHPFSKQYLPTTTLESQGNGEIFLLLKNSSNKWKSSSYSLSE